MKAKTSKPGILLAHVNIPHNKLDNRMNELDKVKNQPIIVVCKHGQSAGAVQAKLAKAGFERVTKLKGGMAQWQADSLPVVKK